jgi:hypothetical protein
LLESAFFFVDVAPVEILLRWSTNFSTNDP